MKTIKNITFVAYREFLKIIKDINLLTVILLAPMLYPFLYGVVYVNKIEQKVPIGIIDEDNTSQSRSLIKDINSLQSVNIIQNYVNPEMLKNAMLDGQIHAGVYIPKEFSENLRKGKRESVTLLISPGRLLVLGDVGIGISQAVNTFGAKVTASVLASKGVPVFLDHTLASPLKFEWSPLYNTFLTYGDMILPALIIIILSQLIVIGSASATAREWSDKAWVKLFEVAGNNYIVVLAGKYFTIASIFIFFSIIIRLVIIPFFDISFTGNSMEVYTIMILGIISSTAFGIFLGTFFKYRITVFAVLGFSTYPMFMVSGYAWPTNQLPEIAKYFGMIFPLTPFLQAIQSITQLGNGFPYIIKYLVLFSVQIVLFSFLSVLRMKYYVKLPSSI